MQYGKVIKPKQLLDANGSHKQEIQTFRGGQPFMQTRYEERVRVTDKAEELTEYAKFRAERPEEDTEFRVERPKRGDSFYYVIKCWSE